MSKKQALITGIGVVSPIGTGLEKFWHNLLDGKSGIDLIRNFDASSFPTKIAAEVKDFDPDKFLTKRQGKIYSKMTQFAVAATKMAMEDADIEEVDPYRTNVFYGSGVSAFDVIDEAILQSNSQLETYKKGAVDPLQAAKVVIHNPSCAIGLHLGIRSYVSTMSTACASGINAVGFAAQRIQDGRADIAITGGGDTPISMLLWGAFCAAKMFTENEDPIDALCPFDIRRTKGTIAEGSAVFILEERDHAVARGAKIYGEITAFEQATENVNELFFADKSGEKWADTIERALDQIDQKKIDYISAHGPSDKFVDNIESKALNKVRDGKLQKTPLSTIKGSIGSGMATAGALQLAAAAMSMHTDQIPAIYNYKMPDPDCDLQFITRRKKKRLHRILLNAKAIGGINAALVLERFKL